MHLVQNLIVAITFSAVVFGALIFDTLALPMVLRANEIQHPNDSTQLASWYDIHFQLTSVSQGHGNFPARYSGTNSLSTSPELAMSLTTTLFCNVHLWKGADFSFHPEIAGGEGLSGAVGIAGFPNGETFRVGAPKPVLYPARIFLRQRFDFNAEPDTISSVLARATAPREELFHRTGSVSRLTLVLGKFGAADFFDESSYSHDPRTQFLNWSLMSAGAWDYPADTRGYTIGFAAEWTQNDWAFAALLTMVPTRANGLELDTRVGEAFGAALQAEYNYTVSERKGVLRALVFRNSANAGRYREAIQHSPSAPDITEVRRYGTTKYGFVISMEQELSEHYGLFARASWNDGTTETWAFTQIDHSAVVGVQVNGNLWKRNNDVFGIATVVNGIAPDHRAYLAAGGYGFIIGDGSLTYALEWITEAYYRFSATPWLSISADYQCIVNPAYNQDRGPVVHIGALRCHIEL